MPHLSPAELKKLRSKQRKAAKKLEQSKAEVKRKEERKLEHKSKSGGGNTDVPDHKQNEKLDPSKLEWTTDPLGEAVHFLKPLQTLLPNKIHTHLMAFEIYLRKEKPLLMLQALKRALRLERNHPELHTCLIRFLKYRQDKLSSEDTTIPEVISVELTRLLPKTDPTRLNEDFLNNNQNSLPHRLHAAKSMVLLDSVQRDRGLEIATSLDEHLTDRTYQIAQLTLEWLESKEFGATPDEVAHYKSQCHAAFPRACVFMPPQSPTANTTTTGTSDASATADGACDSTTATTNSTSTAMANHNHVDTAVVASS
ncbi:hypothetical protein Pcinc_032785 [Petrolisthes cinctipes]|uniref:N-alpha-acetyltransferase 15, NatA auxiliary subunit n=1 Tax=Petrolisthes cinctipes TaxID=88211 RepID=A0AAE1ETC6_PETCI|nr:hypothetical protein Pcinc_032785 [Petrolisthes cinctipes]